MTEIQNLILLLGGWSVVLAGIFLFIGNNVVNRLKIGWEKNAQISLSTLKGEIELKNNTIDRLLLNHSSSTNLLAEKKLTCFDQYWNMIIQLKELNYGTEVLYGYLLDSEIEKLMTDPAQSYQNIRETRLAPIAISYKTIADEVDKKKYAVDRLRPFIGDQLYQLFNIYSIFCMRCTFLLLGGVHKEQSKTWKNDMSLKNMLKDYVTDSEMNTILAATVGSYNLVTGKLEAQIISSIHYSVQGEEIIDKTYLQIEKINTLLNEQRKTTSK